MASGKFQTPPLDPIVGISEVDLLDIAKPLKMKDGSWLEAMSLLWQENT